tara:strand:+ start:643 stop:1863 length:1221 start_codon:yes stop_codon:yes gene_type:complete
MPIPNGGLITETNEQYYAGAQRFISPIGVIQTFTFTTTFNTDLIFGSWNPAEVDYALNNFKLYTSATGLPGTYTEYTTIFTVVDNTIAIPTVPSSTYVAVQLKSLDGGSFGLENAFGDTVEQNYGSYGYTSLDDIINSFMAIYVGEHKLIADVKRTDVIFHAKRGLQEFSYDTLKSIKSQELTIPPSLSVVIPQDYVNYVGMSYIDAFGVKHPIYPANNLTSSPYEAPIQDDAGDLTQDNFGDNLEGSSITNERWANANANLLSGNITAEDYWSYGGWLTGNPFLGQRYGNDPQYAQGNGWFNMNERDGVISFSSNLNGVLIILEYISDGLAYELDSRIPKMAEEALYAHILHAILSGRVNQPEYVVRRLKQERSAKLRNAKIRLSNIKLSEIVQVMRGKSKWIKS